MKVCSICKNSLDESCFRKWKTYCKGCDAAKCREYYRANKEKVLAQKVEYQKAHAEEIKEWRRADYAAKRDAKLEVARAWRSDNPDKVREAKRRHRIKHAAKIYERVIEWRRRNPEALRAMRARRKALKRKTRGSLSAADIKGIWVHQKGKCIACREKLSKTGYHIDHRMPLARGGAHSKENIDLLCPTCNLRKNAKHPIDFMQERGYLL